MKVVLIIQARMGSTRLPGKSMLDLAGAPLIARLIERVKRAGGLEAIVLATTVKTQDDVLKRIADDYGIFSFRGSENDLVDRYYQAAKVFKADIIVRLPGDNPVAEPGEIDRIIEYHRKGLSDFSSNIMQVDNNGYPDGIGAEVFNFEVLEDVWRRGGNPSQREHLATNFYDYFSQKAVYPYRYRIGTVECPQSFRRPDLKLDVNTAEEYEFMRNLYEYLYSRNPQFHITDIIKWYDEIFIKQSLRR
ncbi:MAG: glycosyltransferase family protein [Candidatus Omnitrophica bacterium]|nr:glycosyltransferase family protein [Candidatus Omnitrophota bacterium]